MLLLPLDTWFGGWWIAQDLLQKLTEQFLTGLLLRGTQAGPRLGLPGIRER
jgi:hypothetical protein